MTIMMVLMTNWMHFHWMQGGDAVDTDNDGVRDNADVFPTDAGEAFDFDGDGIGDNADNCALIANGDQVDTDGDAEGDECDLDDDNDGVSDEQEIKRVPIPRPTLLHRLFCSTRC